ncbi:GNAT family N-acetyltransferase [Aureisphaera galaxeae]|uniref:GNAT family N-acetyltransferase n=1 Tax=Aureisphaera galaxeae TaxID=1538023 RepID=UPI00234FC671|nr:GNAT family N-acetyltransferase [Aureisphaera galaxeae]MDC8003895.1 GNAT family N-acetyltransferase [Aureisphaera galaxeae]
MNEIVLRSATLEDLDVLLEFEQGIITAERPFEPTLKSERISYYNIKSFIPADDVEVVVACIADEIIGSGYVKIEKSKSFQKFDYHAYIGFMFVRPEHRGKGVNQLLMDKMLLWAKEKNLTEVRLEVYNDNAPAIRAYEKAGFRKHMIEMRLDVGENTVE